MGHGSKFKNYSSSLLVKLSVATMLSVLPGEASAQNMNCFEPLVFGEIIVCGAAGSVTIRPDNSSTSSCVSLGGAPQSRARCAVTQSFPFRPIQVTIDSTGVINSGGNSMSIDDVNIITNNGGTTTTQTVPFLEIPIGARVNVGASQASGTYSGSLGITSVLQ